VNISGNKPV
jgi:hypothetical protein